MDDLSLDALECTKPDGGVVSSSDRRAVIAFLMLSEDELDRRVQRWFSADTWELWRDGMATRLSRWPFEQVWDEVRHRENAVDGRFRQLRTAGDQLDKAGFDRERARKRRSWRVADRVTAADRRT